MTPHQFISEVLGWLSSHPRYLRWRRPRTALFAVAAMGLMLVVTSMATFLLGLSRMSWLDVTVTYIVVALIALAAAAGTTLAVCAQWAWRDFVATQRAQRSGLQASRAEPLEDEIDGDSPIEINTPPAWLSLLERELKQSIDPHNIQAGDAESSPPSDRDDLRAAFGFLPTRDQAEVLTRFGELYRAASEGDADACCDLLVEGASGVGKSTTLFVCAVMAAFVRGQRVLLVVPDALRQQVAHERLERFLRRLHLHHYVSVAELDREQMTHWLDGTRPLPQIVVASLDAVERDLYGYDAPPGQNNALRRLACLWEVVLVDDLLQFDDAQRLHVPFLLDKHRLTLAAELLPLQCVVTCRQLSAMGRRIVTERLLTLRHAQNEVHAIRLKPPRGIGAWQVRWTRQEGDDDLKKLSIWLRERGHNVVVYRPHLDAAARKALHDRLLTDGEGELVVVGDLETAAVEIDAERVDAILYEEQADEVALALRMHAGHAGTVLFCLAREEGRPEAEDGVVPVLASRYAARMAAAHMASAARVMRPWTPIELPLWHRLGIEPRELPIADADQTAGVAWLVDQWSEDERELTIWPFMSLDSAVDTSRPVSTHTLPDDTFTLLATADRDHLLLTKRSGVTDKSKSSRRARWYDGLTRLDEVSEVDLAHASQFKLRCGRLRLGVSALDRDEFGIVRILGRSWQGGGADRTQAVYDLELTIGEGLSAGGFWGGADDRLRWFRLEGETTQIDARIIGLTNAHGQTSDIQPIVFDFATQVSGLILQPMNIEYDKLSEMHQRRLKGDWSTDARGFWGAMCGAMNFAIGARAPGAGQFVRVLAYELTGDQGRLGAALIWFIEPAGTGRTASRLVEELLRDPRERANLFSAAGWFLRKAPEEGDDFRRFFRRHGGLGLADDDRPGNANGALRLITPLMET